MMRRPFWTTTKKKGPALFQTSTARSCCAARRPRRREARVPKEKRSLVDEVAAAAKDSKPGFKTWFERLSPEVQAELLEVKAAFDRTRFQKNAYAAAVIAACKARGWDVCGKQGVIDWLDRT